MPMLKRACQQCGNRDAIWSRSVTEPNDVEWEITEQGFERMIVLSTQRVRYYTCMECGSNNP